MNPPTDSQALLRQRVGALALAAFGLVFIWRSVSDLPFGTIDNPGPAVTPLILASLLVLLALWNFVGGGASPPAGGEAAEAEATAAEPGGVRHAVVVIAGIAAAALAFGYLGYRLTILGLLVFFLGVVERKPILVVLLIAFGLSLGSHALFVHVLKVPLPTGPWGL